jgi:hypothetical protein
VATVLRSAAGRLVSGVGVFLLAFGVLNVFTAPMAFQGIRSISDFLFGVVGLVGNILVSLGALSGGSRLRVLGRRLRQPNGTEVLRTAVEFILLLRSFELDKYRYVDESLFGRALEWSPIGEGYRKLVLGPPLEAPLAAAFGKFYPVLTVGRPGERLPAVGAARLYFDANDWHRRVEELIGRARLVVLIAGASAGVLWELQTVERAKALEKLVIYVAIDPNNPDVSNERWRTFRDALQATTSFSFADIPTAFATDVMILVGVTDSQPQVALIRPPSFEAVSPWPYSRKLGEPIVKEDAESELCTMARTVLAVTAH